MSTQLHAGPLTLRYDRGELREIRFGDREVLRRVYTVFQDLNWTNRPWRTIDERINLLDEGFEVSYTAVSSTAPCRIEVSIIGDRLGSITYTTCITADNTFSRNRLGLCVLHPINETAGTPIEILHVDGSVETTTFPLEISPFQPFMDVQAMTHHVSDNLTATVTFTGEVFETEDHRNWSDASFKTYCTPISLPFPVELAAGSSFEHSMTLTLSGDASPSAAPPTNVIVEVSDERLPLPRIGVGLDEPNGRVAEFAYFTEFNRDPDAANDADVVMFSITPQVHFFDDETLVQNTVTHGMIGKNARRLAGDRELWIRPITLRPRYNPNATGPEPDFTNVDDRQGTWFTEAWTAMSIKSLALAGAVDVVSYFEADGPRGVANTPTEALFRDVAAADGVFATHSNLPERVDVLALHLGGEVLLICANFSGFDEVVTFRGFVNDTITLDAHSVTRIRKAGE